MSHGLLAQVAVRVHALRFGDGLDGLAFGVGLRVVVGDLPRGLVLDDDDGLVVVARVSSRIAQARAIRYEIARAALRLAEIPHTRADAVALARLLAGPGTVRCGRLPHGEPEKGGC